MKSIFILTFQLFQISKLLVLSRSGFRWNHWKDCCIVSTRLRLSLFEWNKTENALQIEKQMFAITALLAEKYQREERNLVSTGAVETILLPQNQLMAEIPRAKKMQMMQTDTKYFDMCQCAKWSSTCSKMAKLKNTKVTVRFVWVAIGRVSRQRAAAEHKLWSCKPR